jgi:serine protease Do
MGQLLKELNADLTATVQKVRRSLVQISNGRGSQGAGTLWHKQGLVITNAHVIQDDAPQVTLADQRTFPAKVLAYDPQLDLAALSIQADDLPTIELGDSNSLQAGQLVLALGHPWGVTGAVSAGPVINVGLPPEIGHLNRSFVQAGLQLRPGHSGGPLVDTDGRLVGINTMITGPEVGLAIPIDAVKAFLRDKLGNNEESKSFAF